MAAPILPNEKSSLTLSSYELVPDSKEKPSKLGTGSFACVRLAREKKSGKHFALKIINLNPEKLSKADLYYLRTEIQIHRQLDHPNVVKFHGYAQEGFKLYFALDYAEKGNLYTYIQNNKVLTPNEVFNFFYQTCLAVQYIHENNVMHRDIKPENILIDKDFNIKLCDFGWSARNIRDKRTTLCGTYEYMAPEIVWKKPYDYRIDVWSLGVLLYELIHREAPYKGRSLAEITESFRKPLLSFARDIQPEVKDLIQKILKIDPEERISISDILSHTWVKYHLMKREYSQRIANASSSNPNSRAKTAESSLSPRFKQNFYMNQLQIGSKVQQKDKSMCLPLNMTQPPQEQSRDDSPMLQVKSAAATPRVLQADRSMVMDRSIVIEKKVVADKTENIMQQSKTLATTESESNLTTTSMSYLNTSYSEKALGYSSATLPKKLAEKWAETTKNSNDPTQNRRLFQKDIMSPDFNTKLNGILQQLNASVANRKHLSMMSGILSPQSQNQNQDKGTQLNVTFLQNSRESRGIRQALTKENNHNMTCDFSNIQLDSYKVKYNNAGRGASRFNLNNSNIRLDNIQSNAEPSLNSSITTLKANFIGRQKAETTKASYQKYFAFESGLSSQKTNESYLSRTALDSTLDSSMLSFSKRPRGGGEGYSSPFSSTNELQRKLTLKLDNSISYKAPTVVQSTKNKENKVEFFRAQSLMENLLSQR